MEPPKRPGVRPGVGRGVARDPRAPVIVGIGQVAHHPVGDDAVRNAVDSVTLMAEAVELALADCGSVGLVRFGDGTRTWATSTDQSLMRTCTEIECVGQPVEVTSGTFSLERRIARSRDSDILLSMSKTSVEIDRDIAKQVAEILGTTTLRETINASMLEVINAERRLEFAVMMAEEGRFDFNVAERAWGGNC